MVLKIRLTLNIRPALTLLVEKSTLLRIRNLLEKSVAKVRYADVAYINRTANSTVEFSNMICIRLHLSIISGMPPHEW